MQPVVAKIFPLTLLCLLALVIFWLNRATLIDDVDTTLDPSLPQYVLTDIQWQRFDKEGQLADKLSAKEVFQHPNASEMMLRQPQIQLQQGVEMLELSAQSAKIDHESNQITLQDDVVLKQYDQQQQQKIALYAPFMVLDRQQQILIAQGKMGQQPSKIRAVIYADKAILY